MNLFRHGRLGALLLFTFLYISTGAAGQQRGTLPMVKDSWSRPYEPFRIVGNLYYVGTEDLACYLVTTPKGHILINTGLASSVSLLRNNIEALGFRFSDIRILLTTQAHYDHVSGMAAIKKAIGARMMVDSEDAPVLEDGGNSDYAFGGHGQLFVPVHADRLLHDRDTIRLGGMNLVMLHHPGHTKGSCSFLFDVADSHRVYRVLIANMPSILSQTRFPGMPSYPDAGKDYAYTFKAMKAIRFDIWLASHASQFGMHQKHRPGAGYNPGAFADRPGYDAALSELEKEYLAKVAASPSH